MVVRAKRTEAILRPDAGAGRVWQSGGVMCQQPAPNPPDPALSVALQRRSVNCILLGSRVLLLVWMATLHRSGCCIYVDHYYAYMAAPRSMQSRHARCTTRALHLHTYAPADTHDA